MQKFFRKCNKTGVLNTQMDWAHFGTRIVSWHDIRKHAGKSNNVDSCRYDHVTPLLNDLQWLRVPERITYKLHKRSGVQLSSWHGAEVSTRCHSACYWCNVAPSTAVCIDIRSCGASNTSFNAWRQSLCSCWTTRMEQFTWVRHRLLVTSHLQEIP